MPNDANLPEPTIPALALQQTTGPAGFALQNGTPTILSWTAPNDGGMHRVVVAASLGVTTLQVGGAVQVRFTTPGGQAAAITLFAGALAAGGYGPGSDTTLVVGAGTTVSVAQSSAQTGGAATVWADIWGS